MLKSNKDIDRPPCTGNVRKESLFAPDVDGGEYFSLDIVSPMIGTTPILIAH